MPLILHIPFTRARDIPEKAEGIEIYNCFDYQVMRLHWNGCGLLLHEFCHLIHQFTLSDGLDNAKVIEAFETATKSGLYDNTLRYDYVNQLGATVLSEYLVSYAFVYVI